MNTIQRKYETDEDKKIELELGEKFMQLYPEYKLKNQGFLATYDFIGFKNNAIDMFLEVKKKSGFFSDSEMIPITKWNYAKNCPHRCYMMIERDNKAILFDITSIIKNNAGVEREIKRRVDQPEGSRKVVFFKTELGKVIYYL